MVMDITEEVSIDSWKKISVSRFLRMFNFDHRLQNEKISILSLWQKKRLYLVTLLLKNPNFLILDEPTNDLDIFTLTEVEDFLSNFQWWLFIVSHDRFFIDKLADHLLIMEGEWKVAFYTWEYSEYRRLQAIENKESKDKTDKKTEKKISKKDKNRIKKIEDRLSLLSEKKDKLKSLISKESTNADRIQELSLEFWALEKEIEDLEYEWFELSS